MPHSFLKLPRNAAHWNIINITFIGNCESNKQVGLSKIQYHSEIFQKIQENPRQFRKKFRQIHKYSRKKWKNGEILDNIFYKI